MAQKFTYRGVPWEEIEKMDITEFAKLVPSRERRVLKRGFTPVQKKFLKNIRTNREKFWRTRARQMVIIPELVGLQLGIHNGKEYVRVTIIPEMIGHRLGEFSQTRKPVKHSGPGVGATRSSKFVPLK